jgi:hypothetical protein
MGWYLQVSMSEHSVQDLLSILPAAFIVLGVAPLLQKGHGARINLSAWAVIVANAWLAAVGNAFAEQKGASAVYLFLNAVILSPVLIFNVKTGVWGGLPSWQKFAAVLLPVGTALGVLLGGEYATWTAVVVSICLCAQLVEALARNLTREHLLTWAWFLAADGFALVFGWRDAAFSLKVLLLVWVLQCILVMSIEIVHRLADKKKVVV